LNYNNDIFSGEKVINEQERILGGTKAKQGEFPFVVSITTNGEHLCAGFIYNQRFVVTTVTCVQK
jgi:secreted trypsin-like serine protease